MTFAVNTSKILRYYYFDDIGSARNRHRICRPLLLELAE
jgi:hypothetical protein